MIDWSDSDTPPSSIWKNPLCSDDHNLLVADGAIHFRDNVIKNLRSQIAALQAKNQLLSIELDATRGSVPQESE